MKDLIPTEEEFEMIISSLSNYLSRLSLDVANEEVLKASQRISDRTKPLSENEKAFEEAFAPTEAVKGAFDFLQALEAEIDHKAVAARVSEEAEKLLLLSAKMVSLRDECRNLGTARAIEELLK